MTTTTTQYIPSVPIVPNVPNDPRPADDPRIEVITQLRARPYYIPSLKSPFKDWPDSINPHYPQLKASLDARINMYAPISKNKIRFSMLTQFLAAARMFSPEKAAELIKGDYGLCTCLWWPRATLERLETCTFWFLWLFNWDDEIDQSTSELFLSLPKANKFRDESYHFVRYCLGVPTEETDKWEFQKNMPTRLLIRCLDTISEKLRQAYSKEQVMVFVDAIGHYMSSQQHEQGRKLMGEFPTPEQYWETRLGTSAVLSMLALNEYADEQSIPRWIMTHDYMTTIWHESNFNISLLNDILSLKKEIKHGDIDSIVPVLMYHRAFTVQEAIVDVYVEIRKNVHRFDDAVNALLNLVKDKEPQKWGEVDRYITGCRHQITGNLIWSLASPRYGLGHIPRDVHGGIMVDPTAV